MMGASNHQKERGEATPLDSSPALFGFTQLGLRATHKTHGTSRVSTIKTNEDSLA